MIGLSAGYDIQSCITLSQAALYVWKIGICGELDGPQLKSSLGDGRPNTGALDLSCLPAERTLR